MASINLAAGQAVQRSGFPNGNFTVGCWARANAGSQDFRGIIMIGQEGANQNDDANTCLLLRSNGSLELWIPFAFPAADATASGFWATGVWRFFALWCDGTTARVYTRLEEETELTLALEAAYDEAAEDWVVFGNDAFAGEDLIGQVRGTFARDAALSESDILAQSAAIDAEAVEQWAMWPLDGTDLSDVSGNSRPLSAVGTPTSNADEPDASLGGGGEQDILPSSIASAEAFGGATATPGAVGISPSAIATLEAFGDPEVVFGLITEAIASAESVPGPTVAHGGQGLAPGAIGSAESVAEPAITPGAVAVAPDAVTSAESVPAPAVLTAKTPVCRHYVDEATSGQTPTHVLDSEADPTNLEIAYIGAIPAYTAVASGRGLDFPSQSSPKGAGAFSERLEPGQKVYDALEGKRKATVVAVVEIASPISVYDGINPCNIYGIVRWDGEYDALLLWVWDDVLWFDVTGSGGDPSSYYARAYALSDLGPGLHVLTAVYDSEEASAGDRMRVYAGDTLLTPVTVDGTVPLNETLHIQIDASTPDFIAPAGGRYDCQIALGSYQDYFAGNGGWLGKFHFGAIYSDALTASDVAALAAALEVNHDSPTPALNLLPTAITTAESVPGPALATGAVSVAPSAITSDESVPGPTVAPGTVGVAPDAVPTAESVPGPALLPGAVSVAPPAVPSAESVPGPTLEPGAVAVLPGSVASSESVPAPLVSSADSANLAPSSIGTTESVSEPAVAPGSVAVAPPAVASAEAVSGPAVGAGGVSVAPAAVASAEAVPGPAVASGAVGVAPSSIGSVESVPGPLVRPGAAVVAPDPIPTGEDVGEPLIDASGVLTLLPLSVPSAESVPGPAVVPGAVAVAPAGIPTAESVPAPSFTLRIEPVAIASGEGVGDPTLEVGAVVLQPPSVASGESFGNLAISLDVLVQAIATAEAFGSASLGYELGPEAVASLEAFGTAELEPGPVAIVVLSIPTGEAFGTPFLIEVSNFAPAATARLSPAFDLSSSRRMAPTVELDGRRFSHKFTIG